MTDNEKNNLYSFYQEYAKKVRALSAAFWNLAKIWEICENLEIDANAPTEIDFQFQSYPFNRSFDEMCSEVEAFKDEVQDWVDNVAPGELEL